MLALVADLRLLRVVDVLLQAAVGLAMVMDKGAATA